jgi:hypothetical protein
MYNIYMSITPINEQAIKPRYKMLKNGATYDMQTHRIASIDPSKNPHTFTSETALIAVNRRKDMIRQAIEDGIIEGTGAPPGNLGKGLQTIVSAQTKIATGDSSRSTDAARLVLQAVDAMPDKQSAPVQAPPAMTIDQANLFLALSDRWLERQANVVPGVATQADLDPAMIEGIAVPLADDSIADSQGNGSDSEQAIDNKCAE